MTKWILTILCSVLILVGCQTINPAPALSYSHRVRVIPHSEENISHLEWSPGGEQLLMSNDIGYVGVAFMDSSHKTVSHDFGEDDPEFTGLLAAHWLTNHNILVPLLDGDVQLWPGDLSKKIMDYHFSDTAVREDGNAFISNSGRYIGYGNQVFDTKTDHLLTKPSLAGDMPAGFLGNRYYLINDYPGWIVGDIHFWDLQTGTVDERPLKQPRMILPSHSGNRYAVVLFPSRGWLSGFQSSTLRLYDGTSQTLLGSVEDKINANVAFSTDDSWLACADEDNRIRVFDTTALKPLLVTGALPSRIRGITTSRDLLAAWEENGAMTVWNIREKKILGQINTPKTGLGSNPVVTVAINKDQKRIAVAYRSGEVEILSLSE